MNDPILLASIVGVVMLLIGMAIGRAQEAKNYPRRDDDYRD